MHKENSREFKGQFKAGHYRITDFEIFLKFLIDISVTTKVILLLHYI